MSPHPTTILILGTLDSKASEYLHLHSLLSTISPSARLLLLDASRTETTGIPQITHPQPALLSAAGIDPAELKSLPRGEVIKNLIAACSLTVRRLHENCQIHAAVALGGSGGTALASGVFRVALPLGFPKLIVSTVASADVAHYVGEMDLTLMYSVVDIAGLNGMLKSVLANAAAAVAGMAERYAEALERPPEHRGRKRGVGVTMFGVTTPAVDRARKAMEEKGYEVYVFHATGAGGKAMERMITEGRVDGVLDLTTTELADELIGGVFSAGEERLTGAAKKGIPQVVSVGALDMVNWGPKDTVPDKFKLRTLFEHNPSVTLMRTTTDECRELGRRIGARLKDCPKMDSTEVWLPLKGVSMLSVEGQAFHDKEADEALFGAIKESLQSSDVKVVEKDTHINDGAFAEKTAARLMEMLEQSS